MCQFYYRRLTHLRWGGIIFVRVTTISPQDPNPMYDIRHKYLVNLPEVA